MIQIFPIRKIMMIRRAGKAKTDSLSVILKNTKKTVDYNVGGLFYAIID